MRTELKTDLQRAIKEYKRSNCPKLTQRKEILKAIDIEINIHKKDLEDLKKFIEKLFSEQ